jgi:hypothetical protein
MGTFNTIRDNQASTPEEMRKQHPFCAGALLGRFRVWVAWHHDSYISIARGGIEEVFAWIAVEGGCIVWEEVGEERAEDVFRGVIGIFLDIDVSVC